MTRLRPRCAAGALLAAVLLAAMSVSAASAAEGFRRSHALVIGISDYADPDWPDLTHPGRDARAMAAFLRAQGFEVIELYDRAATRAGINRALEDELPARIADGDRVVLFYSGHGHTRSFGGVDYGYLVPHDADAGTGSMIAMDSLNNWSQKIGSARHQLFLMDACFGGLLAPKASAMPAVDPDHPDYIREISRRAARQYMTAGGADQQVLDGGPKGYSYFTGYLLEALQDGFGDLDGDGYITASELAGYLVPRATNRYQTPGAGTLPGHGLGDFFFRAPGRAVAARSTGAAVDAARKGRDQLAARPPDGDAAVESPPTVTGRSLASLVGARTDEARRAMTRFLRATGYGRVTTTTVDHLEVLETLSDGPDRARLTVRYHASNSRKKIFLRDTDTIEVRLVDDRLVFSDGRQ